MSVILNLETKNDILNNIISNNPYYIDIKGSVNICLVRCGQEIEACESVNFSTMTNYGKILVLNKSTNSNSKCAIKLAFDSTNDSLDNNGDANYNFETAFVSIPSLHKLNGTIYDMETFLVFYSVQKNGNVLYVCLCTFNMGVNSVAQGDWKLLNYKLMDELFAQKNIVPDIFGTNEITGIPNPVDINNFIPIKGSRNFYDYTHPKNTKVNFRVFQTPLSVSNNVINTLKSKLTPGNTYVNFKNAISQTINPLEGLFFYFSEDLTDRYKSFAANNPPSTKTESKEISEEEESNDYNLKKLDMISEENEAENIREEDESFNDENKKKESFQANKNQNKASTTYAVYLLITIFCIICIYNYLIKNFFKSINGISEEDLINYTNEIFNSNMTKVLGSKFKINIYSTIIFIFTFIIIFLLVISIPLNNHNYNTSSIFSTVYSFIIILIIVIPILFRYYLRYLYYRIKGFYDPDFTQKENYLYTFISNKIYNYNFLDNFKNIFKENFTNFLINIPPSNIQTGGGDFNHAPGNLNDNHINAKIAENKKDLDAIGEFSIQNFFKLMNNKFVKTVFQNNNQYKSSINYIIGYIILFYIIGSFLQLVFSSIGDNMWMKFLVSFLTSIVLYSPICFMLIEYVNSISNINLRYIIIIFSLIILLLSVFTIFINPINNIPINNSGFWITFSLIIISIITIFISKRFINNTGTKGGDDSKPPSDEEYDLLKKIAILQSQLKDEKSKTSVFENYLEENPTAPHNENESNNNQTNTNKNELLKRIAILEQQKKETESKDHLLENFIEHDYDNRIGEKSYNINANQKELELEYLKEITILKEKLKQKESKEALFKNYIRNHEYNDENKESNNEDESKTQKPYNIDNQNKNKINELQKQLAILQNNLNSKSENYNKLLSNFDDSKKQIELLKKIIPKQNLIKTLEYLKLISNIFNKLQELKSTQDSLNKKNKILKLLDQLSKIDQPSNIPKYFESELKNLNKENPENYKIIIENLDKIINKIKDLAQSIIKNIK